MADRSICALMLSYIDPGSGSLAIQLVIASIATLFYLAKVWWRQIMVFLRISKREEHLRDAD